MRRKIIALWIIVLFVLTASFDIIPIDSAKDIYQFYLNNFQLDTGAFNAVTAIYLDYRAFDTLFETLLLLISVIGVIYFSRHEGGY